MKTTIAAEDQAKALRPLSAREQMKQRDIPTSTVKIDQTEIHRRNRFAMRPKPDWWLEWLLGPWRE
jgi:hypothetical protein